MRSKANALHARYKQFKRREGMVELLQARNLVGKARERPRVSCVFIGCIVEANACQLMPYVANVGVEDRPPQG